MIMPVTTLDIKFNEEGFLVNANEWSEGLANVLAEEEGIMELTDRHWQVIRFMRKEYQENDEVPTIRRLKNAGGIPTKELYELFPNGPAKKAARISGLPKPKGCV
jgi:tRNA 2-thiouridine synthesizing protein E